MPRISFPARNQIWEPSYLGDYWGDFTNSFNLNFSKSLGKIVPGGSLAGTTNQDISSLGRITPSLPLVPYVASQVPTGFVIFKGTIWAVADRVYRESESSYEFEPDSYANSPVLLDDADIIVFRDQNDDPILIVSKSTDLAKLGYNSTSWDANWWTVTLGQPPLNDTVHPLAVLGKHLFIGDGHLLHSVDQGGNVYKRRLIFPYDAKIKWIKTTPERVFLGVFYSESKFSVVEYDPLNEKAREFIIDDGECVGFILDDNLHILTEIGNLKYFNGNGFTYYADFPNKASGIRTLPHRNGIAVGREGPLFLVNYLKIPDSLAGIYLYDKKTGAVYHKHSIVFNYDSLLSFGVGVFEKVGALFYSYRAHRFFYSDYSHNLYAGVELYKTGLNLQSGIYCLYPPPHLEGNRKREARGFIVLPKLKSTEIDNLWQNVFCKYYLSRGKIIIKYQKEIPDYKNKYFKEDFYKGTWITSNSFTFEAPLNIGWQKGDEVYILGGNGAGLSSHITDIDFVNRVITIEDSVNGASGRFLFLVDNYRKLGEITDVNSMNQKLPFPEIVNSNWIRLKIELRGEVELEEVQIQYQPNTQIE